MKKSGFTLVELIIVMAVVAILASVVIPSFSKHVRTSRRSEAITTLLTTHRNYEQYYSENGSYPTSNTELPSNSDYYQYSSTVSGKIYTITATAQSGQTADEDRGQSCSSLSINNTGYMAPPECWH